METIPKTAVIYARVSSVIGDRQNTDRQVKDLTRYASAQNFNLTKVFTEKVSGAKKNSERPVLTECLEYCISNGIDTIILSELSRLGRDAWEVQENAKKCVDNAIDVYFQKEKFNLLNEDRKPNPYAAVIISVLATGAQMEREAIMFRMKSGYRNHLAKGGEVGRKKGYRKPKEAKESEYKEVIKKLRMAKEMKEKGINAKEYSIRGIADSFGFDANGKHNVGVSTVQRLKKEFEL